MAIWLAALLISTLTSTGLLALWAATSPRHWFVRTAGFLAALSPLLLIPAYEPLVALALQGAIVATGVTLGRVRAGRLHSHLARAESSATPATSTSRRPRFSLATLLLAMVLCGFAAAIAANAPRLNRYAWQSVAVIGLCGGAATLLGWWAATRRGWRLGPATAVALAVAASVAALPAWFDWLFLSFLHDFQQWPPDPLGASAALIPPGDDRPVAAWFAILTTVTLLIFTLTMIDSLANCILTGETKRRWTGCRRGASLAALAILAAAVALPAATGLYVLLTPEPIPNVQLPKPNGYDDFNAAGVLIESTPIGTGAIDWETATVAQLQSQMAASSEAMKRVHVGLERDSYVPVDYRSPDLWWLSHISRLRNLGRALAAKGRLAELEGRWGDAIESHLLAVELGVASVHGGLMIDALVGAAVASAGAREVYEMRGDLDAAQCRCGAAKILAALATIEPKEYFHARDRIWSQHANGWHGRLALALTDLTKIYPLVWGPDGFLEAMDRQIVVFRLTALELLAQAMFIESGRWPQAIEELEVAGQPADAWLDPFDPKGGRLRLLDRDDGIVFYSRGYNRVDDGGTPANPDAVPIDGDLRLDALYAP